MNMTDEQIDARIKELRNKPITKCTEAEVRELLEYYGDDQLREIHTKLSDHIKSIARKKKHFAEYWRCKDIMKWVHDEECKRPMTSDFLNGMFKFNFK
jgi:hypothetical protein